MKHKKTPKAIDLYSGVGGWSLGLKLAGIEVVASYEWWRPALRSNEINNRHLGIEGDIRSLPLDAFQHDVDIVVGSPPCTQFSFSNRGGKGDIEDGLCDIRKFLEVVEYVKPKYWLMENVPRVAQIVRDELGPGGSLHRFARLNPQIRVIDMGEFGLPQSRSRCIVGNIDFELLLSYRAKCRKRTLGSVIRALSSRNRITDPIYKISCKPADLVDHRLENPLSPEEERMNREAKTFHPVYNNMSFPDRFDRPVRTITATCTRVSRESVIVQDGDAYRRLTVRERATLQGFPIKFQFYGDSYQQKLKMIGNAIPPLFTFYAAQAMKGTAASRLKEPHVAIREFTPPTERPKETPPDTVGRLYPDDRRFRAALPHLRFKSGVRFELANDVAVRGTSWGVKFYFGNSKNIHEVIPSRSIMAEALARPRKHWKVLLDQVGKEIVAKLSSVNQDELQRMWTRSFSDSQMLHPYELVDFLGGQARILLNALEKEPTLCKQAVQEILEHWARTLPSETEVVGIRKVLNHSPAVLSGLLIGYFANEGFSTFQRSTAKHPSSRRLPIAA